MLQSKEDIIKKIANISDEHSKNILSSKERTINDLRKELKEAQTNLEDKKNELNLLNEKTYNL